MNAEQKERDGTKLATHTGKPSVIHTFGYFGGKFHALPWLLPLLPECGHYVEPFAGSGVVLLNRQPSKLETYNDADAELFNFFSVLRDNGARLRAKLKLTLHSRREFIAAFEADAGDTPLEQARKTAIRFCQAYLSKGMGAYNFGYAADPAISHALPAKWIAFVKRLDAVQRRLGEVQIEHKPALDLIQRYDFPGTLFYCDPPYSMQCRKQAAGYRNEMTEADHRQLAAALHHISGRAAISSYRCPLYDRLYSTWLRHDAPARCIPSASRFGKTRADKLRVECLWTNYEPHQPGAPLLPHPLRMAA